MSIPDTFTAELLERVSLAQVIGTSLTWDQKKSQPGKGDYWACCPFHAESTPSFHVDDRKGYYYCFGCHEKGNAISFLRKTGNLGYREAIEFLARMAGMQVPAGRRQDPAKTERLKQLSAICETASFFYQEALQSQTGLGAKKYLAERGVSKETIKQFGIGYAPDGRLLAERLSSKSISEQQMLDAGLVAKSDRDGSIYARFRDRLIFPIRDTRGRTIAFGGRAMRSGVPAKYLNSPETDIFKKGSSLFNHGPARDAMRSGGPLIIVEGYMDVIALSQAGLGSCVAPLGTAITEIQMRRIFAISPKPILALDGDIAGQRAAEKACRLALPLLEPGRGLQICMMHEGADPDDVVRRAGKDGMLELLGKSLQLAEFLWQCESRDRDISSPEGRAEFEAGLMRTVGTIKDLTVRKHFRMHYERRLGIAGPASRGRQHHSEAPKRNWNRPRESEPTAELRNSQLAKAAGNSGIRQDLRESVILSLCLNIPQIIPGCLDLLESLEMQGQDRQEALYSIIEHHQIAGHDVGSFRESVAGDVGELSVQGLLSIPQVANLPIVKAIANGSPGCGDRARAALSQEIDKLKTARGAEAELQAAKQEIIGEDGDPAGRLVKAVGAREEAKRGAATAGSGELITLENGVRVTADELRAFESACS